MFHKNIDYDALWNEIENELDTDVSIDEFQDAPSIFPSSYYGDARYPYSYQKKQYHYDKCHHPFYFIYFPHRRHFH